VHSDLLRGPAAAGLSGEGTKGHRQQRLGKAYRGTGPPRTHRSVRLASLVRPAWPTF
jgi:hypothetical protein